MDIKGKRTNLRIVDEDDAEFILSLRIDAKKSRFISKVDDDLLAQMEWIRRYKAREATSEEFYFIIEDKDKEKHGCVRLYDFKGDSFCWGSWLIKEGSPSYLAIESALLVYQFAFYRLGFVNCHFDVRKGNSKVVAFHQRFGATIVSEDDMNYYFAYSEVDYEAIKERYSKYLPEDR